MNKLYKFSLALMLGTMALATDAQTVKGHIYCNGVGVEGVIVSDGYVVTKTNSFGAYSFTSEKKNGYVFYTLPSGYEPEVKDGYDPVFWAALDASKTDAETHDFTLTKKDNDKFTLVVSTDYHLANRNSDLSQFKNRFVARMKELKKTATTPVYSTILGDLTWDLYWTQKNYNLSNYKATMKSDAFPFMSFPVIGNHDNDPSVAFSTTTDFDSAEPWRNTIGPTYYSYNLGKLHFIVLDDVYYVNTKTAGASYPDGVVGDRNYLSYITTEQWNWLEKDLAEVDKNTPVIVELHVPTWTLKENTFVPTQNLNSSHTKKLCDMLADYKNVHILSGHTHVNEVSRPTAYPNIIEHNIGAVCASWWWTYKLTSRDVCTDGSPGGYSLWEVDGTDIKWKYCSSSDNNATQMRLFDMNTVRDFYKSDDDLKKMLAAYTSRADFSTIADNVVMANVFAYDTDWKIEFIEDGQTLSYKRVTSEDPYHTLCYDLPRYKANGSYTETFATTRNSHFFQATCKTADSPVTVKVTDSFGQEYIKTLNRPAEFNLNMDNFQPQTLGVNDVVSDKSSNKCIVHTNGSTLVIDATKAGTAQLVNINGIARTLNLSEGRNEFDVNAKGFYVVNVEGEGHKVIF